VALARRTRQAHRQKARFVRFAQLDLRACLRPCQQRLQRTLQNAFGIRSAPELELLLRHPREHFEDAAVVGGLGFGKHA
jgi:hypothetical protein